MSDNKYWLKRLFTRKNFAMPLLQAAMFAWLMATLNVIQSMFNGYKTIIIRWILTGLIFWASFYIYIDWDRVEEEAEETIKETKE